MPRYKASTIVVEAGLLVVTNDLRNSKVIETQEIENDKKKVKNRTLNRNTLYTVLMNFLVNRSIRLTVSSCF